MNQSVAIYGLGVETEKVLPALHKQYHILGLLDSFRTSGELYGEQIISLDQAIAYGCKKIIVIARPGSCKAIAAKIGDRCKSAGISLVNQQEQDLLSYHATKYDFSDLKGCNRAELERQASEADAISFDLFDTLITRCVPTQEDVFHLVAIKLGFDQVDSFIQIRLRAEKELSRDHAPTLRTIYQSVLKEIKIDKSAEELATLEFEADLSLLIPRQEMCKFFAEQADKKPVFITTDSYYSKKQIQNILSTFGIEREADLIVSSEYDTAKTGKLFSQLICFANKYMGEREANHVVPGMEDKSYRILHIGDDIFSDIQSAEINGIDTFHIYSPSQMMEATGNLGLSDFLKNITDKVKAGILQAVLFNNPFITTKEQIKVEAEETIGEVCFAPIITDFTLWMRERIVDENLNEIWLSARDGFLFERLFRRLGIKASYFLTSRVAAIRAGVYTEEDLAYIANMKYSGTIEEELKARFGIDVGIGNQVTTPENNKRDQTSDLEGRFESYKNSIFEVTKVNRKNYKKYIENLEKDFWYESSELKHQDMPIAFFDFVAKGTVQYFISNLIDRKLKGFYFMQNEPDNMKNMHLDIEGFYSGNAAKEGGIYEDYYILEPILSAPEPSLDGFDQNGEPLFAKETRKTADIECMLKVQDGIKRYFDLILQILPSTADYTLNKELDEKLLGLIHHLDICCPLFIEMTVEDPFFGRNTDMKALL